MGVLLQSGFGVGAKNVLLIIEIRPCMRLSTSWMRARVASSGILDGVAVATRAGGAGSVAGAEGVSTTFFLLHPPANAIKAANVGPVAIPFFI
jgi:hypothetical protein